MSKLLKYAAIVASILIFGACSERHTDFGFFTPVADRGWTYGDTLSILPQGMVRGNVERRMRIGVVHRPDYPYRNLALEVTYLDGKHLRRDTVEIEMADAYGVWSGSGMGASYQVEAIVTPRSRIPDSSRIAVRHIMRVDTLRGLSSVGILIDEP